jgi:hypothetical protein
MLQGDFKHLDTEQHFSHALAEYWINVFNGLWWVMAAAAHDHIDAGMVTQKHLEPSTEEELEYLYQLLEATPLKHRVAEATSNIIAILQLQDEEFPLFALAQSRRLAEPVNYQEEAESLIKQYWIEALNEVMRIKHELLQRKDELKIVMVAGQQGSGKDTLADYFVDNHGYAKLSLSDIVSHIAELWGLDPHSNPAKIVAGAIFKEYFRPEILVILGVYDLIQKGHNRIVISGPRLLSELDAAQAMGAVTIGVEVDPDPVIDEATRLELVTKRTGRPDDVPNFKTREAKEGPKIREILNNCSIRFINNVPTLAGLHEKIATDPQLESLRLSPPEEKLVISRIEGDVAVYKYTSSV